MLNSRLVRWVIAPVCVVLLFIGIIRSDLVGRPVARLAEAGIELITGEQAVVGSLSIDPITRKVEVLGLIMSHTSNEGVQSPILATERVSVRFGVPWRGAWVKDLVIDRPVVHLHLDEDGLREFQDLEMGGTKADQLPWERISLNNARVELDTTMGSLLLEGIDVETIESDQVDVNVDTVRIQAPGINEVARTVNWKGVTLTPDQVVIPDLRIESQHVRLQGSLDATLGSELRGQMTAAVALSMLNGLGKGSFGGLGHVDIEMSGPIREPKITGAVLVSDLTHEEEGATPIQLERLLAQIEWQGRMLNISESEIDWAEGRLFTRGSIDLISTGITLSTNFEGIDLRSAIREAGGHINSWTTFLGDGDIQAAGTLKPFRLAGSYEIAVQNLDVASGPPDEGQTFTVLGIPNVQLVGHLDVDSEGIWLRNRRAQSGPTSGTIDAFIGFSPDGPLDIEFNFDRASLSTFRPVNNLDLWGFGRLKGTVKGPFSDVRITASSTMYDFHMLGAPLADKVSTRFVCNDLTTLEFLEFDGTLGETEFVGHADVLIQDETTMNVGVEVKQGRVEDLLRIGGADLPWVTGRISGILNLSGDPDSLEGDFDAQLRDVNLAGEQFPSGDLNGWLEDAVVHVGQFSLERWSGEEGVLARGTIDPDWESNLDIVAAGFQLDRLDILQRIKMPMRGSVSVDAVVQGSLLSPQPRGRLAIRNASYGDFPLPDSTLVFRTAEEAVLIDGNLVGDGLEFDGTVSRSGDQAYDVDVRLEDFPLHSVFPEGADGTDVSALLSGALKLQGVLSSKPTLDIVGRGRTLDMTWDRHRLHTLAPWEFELSGKAMRLSGFRVQGAGTDLEWEVSTDASGGLSGSGGGVVDVDLARMVVGGIERADGAVAVNIDVAGTLKEPSWVIDAATCGMTLQGDWFPHPFESLAGLVNIRADGTRLRSMEPSDVGWLERIDMDPGCRASLQRPGVEGRLGDGTLALSGAFTAENWWPKQFDFDAEIENARVQYLEELPPMTGTAKLQLDGPAEELLLAGKIVVNEMMFTDRISWEEWLLELTDSDSSSIEMVNEEPAFSMDIVLSSDNTLRMRNNVADFSAGGELRIIGDTNEPGLVGSVRALPGGRVYLKEREFEVQRAEIHFIDPFTFDPDLDLMLLTDVRSREDQYEVTYRVGGTYENWRAETRSEPSLPAPDVNALLLFGMTRAELERYGGLGGALAVEGGDLLASSFLFSGRKDTDRGGLFRIVDPLRPERLDLVSGVSERGSGAVSSDLRLLYENDLSDVGLPGSLMIFEQNISRATDTYLGFEQRLARTLFARTYWGSEQVGRYLDIGGAYGLEMKVRWELD